MSLETSASESGEKDVNEFMFDGKMSLTDCGVEDCAVRFVILLMKNVKHTKLNSQTYTILIRKTHAFVVYICKCR